MIYTTFLLFASYLPPDSFSLTHSYPLILCSFSLPLFLLFSQYLLSISLLLFSFAPYISHVCVCMYVCICMCVCMCACVCMYVCISGCSPYYWDKALIQYSMYVWMYVWMYVYTFHPHVVCMCVLKL